MSVLAHYIDTVETDADKEQIKTFMKSLYTEAVNVEVV
jgi:ribosomal protein L23